MSQLSQSLAGALLVASPELDDDLFRRTVIYIAAHDRKSTTGLVLNRPLKFLITQLFPEIKQPLPLYWGGPVGYDTMFFLHRCPQWIPGGLPIGAGTYWGGEFSAAKELLAQEKIGGDDIRFFVGYSGWSAGQLEEELEEKAWLLQAPGADPFKHPENRLWEMCLCGTSDDGTLVFPSSQEKHNGLLN